MQSESPIPPSCPVVAAAIGADSPVLRSLEHYCMPTPTATSMAWVHVDMMWWNLRSHKPVVVLHLLRTVLLHPIPTVLLHPVPSIVCIFMHPLPSITYLSLQAIINKITNGLKVQKQLLNCLTRGILGAFSYGIMSQKSHNL